MKSKKNWICMQEEIFCINIVLHTNIVILIYMHRFKISICYFNIINVYFRLVHRCWITRKYY